MDWNREYMQLLVSKIDDLAADYKDLQKCLSRISAEIVTLKTRAALWGGIAGTGFSIVFGAVIQYFVGVKK